MAAERGRQRDVDSESHQFVYDVTLCARKALRKARKQEQDQAKLSQRALNNQQGASRRTAATRASPLRTKSAHTLETGGDAMRTTMSGGASTTMIVSSDALSISWAEKPPRANSAETMGGLPRLGATTGSPAGKKHRRSVSTQGLPRLSKSSSATLGSTNISIKLEDSPLFSNSMTKLEDDKGATSTMSKTLSKMSTSSALPTKPKSSLESTGPTNWSAADLGTKYRGEWERELAWNAFQAATQAAEAAREERVVAVAAVERHPMHQKLSEYAEAENARCALRARARGKMKRFVLDVHQVWLTNLEHLFEHRLAARDAPPRRDRGIANRRDTNGICNVHSQIQSVAPERGWTVTKPAISMAELFEVTFRPVQGKPLPTPDALPIAPSLRCLVAGELHSFASFLPGMPDMRVSISIYRLKRPTKDDADALWRIACYYLDGGGETVTVVAERHVLPIVEGLVREPPAAAAAPTAASVPPTAARALRLRNAASVARLTAMVGFGPQPGERRRCFVQARVSGGGASPVVVDFSVTPVAARPAACFRMTVRASELIRRLALLDTPANHLDWWLSRDPARGATWRRITASLCVSFDEPQSLDGVGAGAGAEAGVLGTPLRASRELGSGVDTGTTGATVGGTGGTRATGLGVRVLGKGEGEDEAESGAEQMSASQLSDLVTMAFGLVPLLELTNRDDESGDDFGDEPTLRLVVPSAPEELRELNGEWEVEADFASSLSMRVCGHAHRVRHVPGVVELDHIGSTVFHFERHEPRDHPFTRAVAVYFRDAELSSSDSVMVTLAYALDTAVLAPTILAWEPLSTLPPLYPLEDPDFMLAPSAALALTLMSEPVISELDERTSVTVVVLTAAEHETDFPHAVATEYESAAAVALRAGHRRRWSERQKHGFRQTAHARLLMPDSVIPTFVFSLTKKLATANGVGLNRRNMWHSQELCSHVLCRARTCDDYIYIARNSRHQGANDPGFYTVHLRHEKLYMLVRGGLESFIREVVSHTA
jgi:hypothetical protein